MRRHLFTSFTFHFFRVVSRPAIPADTRKVATFRSFSRQAGRKRQSPHVSLFHPLILGQECSTDDHPSLSPNQSFSLEYALPFRKRKARARPDSTAAGGWYATIFTLLPSWITTPHPLSPWIPARPSPPACSLYHYFSSEGFRDVAKHDDCRPSISSGSKQQQAAFAGRWSRNSSMMVASSKVQLVIDRKFPWCNI